MTQINPVLRDALEQRYGDGPYATDYPVIDLRRIDSLEALADAIHAHLRTCAAHVEQKPDLETFRTDSTQRPDIAAPGEIVVSWEAGPFQWACASEPLGMLLPRWCLAEPRYSFDLVLRDERDPGRT